MFFLIGTGEKMSHYVPDYNIIEDDGSNPPSRSGTPEPFMQKPTAIVKLMFSATKVSTGNYIPHQSPPPYLPPTPSI